MLDLVNIISLIVGALGCLGGGAALWNARTAAKKGDIDDLRSIIAALREENVRLQTRVNTLETSAAVSRTDISSLREIIEELRKENERLRDKITVLEDGITALRKENSTLRGDNTKMRNRLRELESGARKNNDEQNDS